MAWRGRPTAFADTIERDVGKRVRGIAQGIWTDIILASPVDTGRFRGNNSVSVGTRDYGTTADVDPSGRATLAQGDSVIASSTAGAPFTVIYIQNNLPYARVLEDGSSQQAPRGIYGIALNNAKEQSR